MFIISSFSFTILVKLSACSCNDCFNSNNFCEASASYTRYSIYTSLIKWMYLYSVYMHTWSLYHTYIHRYSYYLRCSFLQPLVFYFEVSHLSIPVFRSLLENSRMLKRTVQCMKQLISRVGGRRALNYAIHYENVHQELWHHSNYLVVYVYRCPISVYFKPV